jgi:hypothetical protein
MTKRSRWLLAIPAALLLAQVVRLPRTNPPAERDVDAPPDVKALLRRACYDCHSHETSWEGWQTQLAPGSWLVARDVRSGRRHLNFSRWGTPQRHVKDIAKELREGDMPPWYYVAFHPGARLSEAERARLLEWAGTISAAAVR